MNELVLDVQEDYKLYRIQGHNRETAIRAIKSAYHRELEDADDKMAVMLGLVLALCKKKELTEEIAEEARACIENVKQYSQDECSVQMYLKKMAQKISLPEVYGKEATYRRKIPYVPDWQEGDLFAHTITHPIADEIGIGGWTILLYKVGEYVDPHQDLWQLVYVTLCPPEEEPTTSQQLQDLGFLRMMRRGNGDRWEYLAHITIKNKKDEALCGLKKIGNFPNITAPTDGVIQDPFYSRPLFGVLKKASISPHFEYDICLLYKRFPVVRGKNYRTGSGLREPY